MEVMTGDMLEEAIRFVIKMVKKVKKKCEKMLEKWWKIVIGGGLKGGWEEKWGYRYRKFGKINKIRI